MKTTKKLSAILPKDLLLEACKLSGLNQTDTLIEALEGLVKSYKRDKLLAMKGKLLSTFNSNKDRERSRL